MRSEMVGQLLDLARSALERTEQGQLVWRRTNAQPREYYASLGEKSALAIRRIRVRSAPPSNPPSDTPAGGIGRAVQAALQQQSAAESQVRQLMGLFPRTAELVDDYRLALVSPQQGELVAVESTDYDLDSPERRLLSDLFQAALLGAEEVQEAVEDAKRVLQEAT